MTGPDGTPMSLAEVVSSAAKGRGGAGFLVGEAGLGKTTMLGRVCSGVPEEGRVGWATGGTLESSIRFGLAGEALRSLGLPVPTAGADVSAGLSGPSFFGVLDALGDLTRAGPVVIAIDDLHWADEPSLALLAFLCRRIGDMPVAVVATLRPWPRHAVDTITALAGRGEAAVRHLAPLGRAAGAELLVRGAGRPVPPSFVDHAMALCAGNPLLLEQVSSSVDLGDDLAQEHLGATFLSRFLAVDPEPLRYAQAAAVLGSPFHPQVAGEVAGLDAGDDRSALATLLISGVLQPVPGLEGSAGFVHPLLEKALYRGLSPPLRTLLHARAYASLHRRGVEPAAAEHAILANLMGDDDVVLTIEKVGRAALLSGQTATATRLLAAACEFAGVRADDGLLLALATAHLAAGRAASAIDVASRVLGREAAAPAMTATALRVIGHAHYVDGHHDLAAASFDEAVRLAEDEAPVVAVEALLLQSVLFVLTDGPASSLPLAAQARRICARADDALALRAEGMWGYVAVLAGDASGFDAAARAAASLEARSRFVPPLQSWRELTMYGAAAKYGERFGDAERIYRMLGPAAENAESPAAVAALCTGYAETLTRVGRLEEALALATRAASSVEGASHVTATLAASTLAHILLLTGRLVESAEWSDRAEAMATAGRGEWLPLLRIWDLQGMRLLRRGRTTDAADVFARAWELTGRVGVREPCVVPWAGHAIAALVADDRVDEATEVIRWLESCAATLPCRWPRIAADAGWALLHERAGNYDAAEAKLRSALACHDQVDLPLDRVETLLGLGAFLRRRGRLVAARPLLAEALRLAEALGAAWHVGPAGEELSLAGGRRRRAGDDPDALTPSEARVARLAATGASNREIAAQLVLSVNTVESHLRHVYAKVGLRSRRDLILKFAAWEDAQV